MSQRMGLHVPPRAAHPDLLGPGRDGQADTGRLFLDVDRGAIEFQRRVFEEVQDDGNPLLERVKFLAILGVNLTRLAHRKRLADRARQLLREAEMYFVRHLGPALACHGIDVRAIAVLTASDLAHLWTVSQLDRPDLHYRPIQPRDDVADSAGSVLDAIRARDILLHHPYDSFRSVVELVRQAAVDPDVMRIAITLYRTDHDSPIGHALVDAVRHGKDVQVVVELKARHDEQNNAEWAAALRHAGAHVTYGIVGLKVHAKLALIVRREGAATRRYVHVSSGNYHAATARAYTDVSVLTCDDDLAADVGELFEFLAGRAGAPTFRKLLVAPLGLRRRVHDLIEREIDLTRRGAIGHVILKMNALTDRDLILQLYRASQAGVRVDLIVRGPCRLRPGVQHLSDHIHVRSVVGRFLEHSRVWYFRNGGGNDIYIGSADLRPRNLDRRIEAMVPVSDSALGRRIRYGILGRYLADTVSARAMRSDGTYVRLSGRHGEQGMSSQRAFLNPSVSGGCP